MNEQSDFQPNQNRKINTFETASFALAILAIITFCCIYASVIFGALSVIFALLSKGGNEKMSATAKRSILIAVVAIVVSAGVTTYSVYTAIHQFGSFDNLMEYYNELYGSYLSDTL